MRLTDCPNRQQNGQHGETRQLSWHCSFFIQVNLAAYYVPNKLLCIQIVVFIAGNRVILVRKFPLQTDQMELQSEFHRN